MENRNVKNISKSLYTVVIGVFLCLVSFSISLNCGYAAKAVSYPFVYLFGIASYILYAFAFTEGIFLIIKKDVLKIKFNKYFWLGLLTFIGASALTTYFYCDQTQNYIAFTNTEETVSLFKKLTDGLSNTKFSDGNHGYFAKGFANIFASKDIGCGIFGYLILAIGNTVFSTTIGGLILSILITFIGVALLIGPSVISWIERLINAKKDNPKSKKPGKTHEVKHRIKNIDVIKDAKNVDPNEYRSEVSGSGTNLEQSLEEPTEPTILQNDIDKPVFNEKTLEEQIRETSPNNYASNELTELVFDVNRDSKQVIETQADEPANILDEEVPPIIENVDPIETNSEENYETVEIHDEPKIVETDSIPPFNLNGEQINVETPVEEPKPKKRQRVEWSPISTDILNSYETSDTVEINSKTAEERKELINNTFNDFGVGASVVDYTIGPSITRFNIRYNPNVSQRTVSNMIQDISIRLNGVSARFESVIEGQSTSGLEIPNAEITTVGFKDVFEALPTNLKKHPLAVAFGKNIKGDVIYADYNEFPHMLISGTTGSGKSVFVNSLICTLIMRNSPDDLKLVLVDPKKVEMSRYADMPHLLTPIITEPTKVKLVLDKLVDEMEYRYSLFSKNNATNIQEYNEDCETNGNEKMPFIIVVLDEYADLVDQCKEISFPVVMLAQKARACGIHLMLSTQRPSTNVVTGVIKANMPTHVALMCASSVDSVTIVGEGGAEKLLGKGDMLVQSPLVSRVGLCRLQSCFIDRKEIIAIVSELKNKYETIYDDNYLNLEEKKEAEEATAEFHDNGENDEESRYQAIKEWVMSQEYMSMSKIQRDCSVGFNRAGRIFTRLQKEGIVSLDAEASRGCKVIVQDKFGDESADAEFTSEDNSYIK